MSFKIPVYHVEVEYMHPDLYAQCSATACRRTPVFRVMFKRPTGENVMLKELCREHMIASPITRALLDDFEDMNNHVG